ncbi:hypothetical protein ABT025_37875 [Streptomyces sp. NPDC002809]|uniref:hypothetical protein n=1 Tax=Streptomyces sp. NPDC002809 TaxID=3154433 RepID=UPI00332DBF26
MWQALGPHGSLWAIMYSEMGPLEFVQDVWVIGDSSGEHLALAPEGLVHRVDGVDRETIAWSRLMNFDLAAQPGKVASSKCLARTAKILANLSGAGYTASGGASVAATLRHPYEDWSADFDHHSRKYPRRHIKLVGELLRQTVEKGAAARLGDPEWMSTTVELLAELAPDASRPQRSVIRDLLDEMD